MSEDILRESWVYEEIGQQYLEERFKKAQEQGRIQGQREMLLSFVQRHFPEVMVLAK